MASEPMTPLKADGRYLNPWGVNNSKSFWSVLKWKLTTQAAAWPESIDFTPIELPAAPTSGALITWVNHATFLVQLPGLNLVIDPVWSERASPLSFLGPKRVHAPGVPWEKLPKIDLVLVSHNHYDHLDIDTLEKLSKRDDPKFFVPLGDLRILQSKGINNVTEMTWWQEVSVGETVITFTPAQHWSARGPWDKNESLWGGWWIKSKDTTLFHAGDTGHGPHFKVIREKLGKPSLAMIPIGAYEPRWFMKTMHMNPDDAVMAFEDLGSPQTVGMHFGTFQLTDEGYKKPAEHLKTALDAKNISSDIFVVPKISESFWVP